MSFFFKRKSGYRTLKKDIKKDNEKDNNSENTFYVYTTGLLNFDSLDDKSMIYLRWKNYFKKIINDIPKKYKIKVVHYDLKTDNNITAVEDNELNKILLQEVLKYMNDHSNFIFEYFDPERLDIEIRFENMIVNFLENIKENHIIYDFSNILNSDIFCNITDYNIINPEYLFFFDNNIIIDDIKLFDYNNELVTYMIIIRKFYGDKIKNINDLINLFETNWNESKKIFWNKNKEIFRLHNFGKIGDIKWKKSFVIDIFHLIWIKDINKDKINEIIGKNFLDLINRNFYE
jgi:hypothetical protein